MAQEWNLVLREVATRLNAITGVQAPVAEASYLAVTVDPSSAVNIKDASYHYSMIKDACINAEMLIAQTVGMATNHPWRHILFKGALTGILGDGLNNGDFIWAVPGSAAVNNCLGLGPVRDAATGGHILREAPIEDIQRRVDNPGGFFQRSVYFYRIQDDRIYHTCPKAFIDYYGYDKSDSETSMLASPNTIMFPHTAIPAYVAGALSLLLKEEEYAAQCQYYAALFAGMMQQIANGFRTIDLMGPPMPLKGTEST